MRGLSHKLEMSGSRMALSGQGEDRFHQESDYFISVGLKKLRSLLLLMICQCNLLEDANGIDLASEIQ